MERDSKWMVSVWPVGFAHPVTRRAASLVEARVVANEMLKKYPNAASAMIREKALFVPYRSKVVPRTLLAARKRGQKPQLKGKPLAGQQRLG